MYVSVCTKSLLRGNKNNECDNGYRQSNLQYDRNMMDGLTEGWMNECIKTIYPYYPSTKYNTFILWR